MSQTPLDAAAEAMWEPEEPTVGWPSWEKAVDRADHGLWDLPQMVADTRDLARKGVTAALDAVDLPEVLHRADPSFSGDPGTYDRLADAVRAAVLDPLAPATDAVAEAIPPT